MEEFKKLSEVHKSDIRNSYWVLMNKDTGKQKSMTLDDVHNNVSCIELKEEVPDEIKSQFNIAKNLHVYSWFSYSFHQISEMKAYSTVEYALKDKFGDHRCGFKKLLKKAIKKGLIKDSGFRHIDTQDSNSIEYSLGLVEIMPSLRNSLSHGSNTLHNQSAITLSICCDLINHLFKSSMERSIL